MIRCKGKGLYSSSCPLQCESSEGGRLSKHRRATGCRPCATAFRLCCLAGASRLFAARSCHLCGFANHLPEPDRAHPGALHPAELEHRVRPHPVHHLQPRLSPGGPRRLGGPRRQELLRQLVAGAVAARDDEEAAGAEQAEGGVDVLPPAVVRAGRVSPGWMGCSGVQWVALRTASPLRWPGGRWRRRCPCPARARTPRPGAPSPGRRPSADTGRTRHASCSASEISTTPTAGRWGDQVRVWRACRWISGNPARSTTARDRSMDDCT